MKTSTKIFLGALLLGAIGLVSYDLRLNAEYRKGTYADPYYRYEKLPFRDFDEVELQSSTAIPIAVMQGDFKVLTNPSLGFVAVRQEGRKLILSAQLRNNYRGVNVTPIVYISCPTLIRFVADAEYFIRGDTVLDRTATGEWNQSYIRGFRQDSLEIEANHAANVVLAGDTIGKLAAKLGGGGRPGRPKPGVPGGGQGGLGNVQVKLKGEPGTPPNPETGTDARQTGNGPILTIDNNNKIDVTDFHVLDQGRLSIKGTGIRQLTYTLADGATLTVNGLAARYLNLH